MFVSVNNLEDEIVMFLDRKGLRGKKYRYRELKKEFCSKRGFKPIELEQAINNAILEGTIYHDTIKDMYRTFPDDLGYAQGPLTITKHNEGLMTFEDGTKYKVKEEDLQDAMDGDTVILKPTKKLEHGHIIAKVERIIKRKDGLLVVEVIKNKDDEYELKPFSAPLKHKIRLNKNEMKLLVEGERAIVQIDELDSDNKYYATFIESIGHKDDPDAELKLIASEHRIQTEFSQEVLDEAEALPTEVSKSEMHGRLDLRDELIFSIDGAKTKDRDDAISIKKLGNGNYQVDVHISDVSHYIHPGMKLWDEAISRGTSVYMADTVIPMLPHKISNGICSLNPNEDRLTFSCLMELNSKGQVITYDFVDTVINSKKAMTYDDVNKLLEENELVDGYEGFADDLITMHELSKKLEKIKRSRGYVDFGTNSEDLEITFDEDGIPQEFHPREQKSAEKIIENFMLLAGECYANYMIIPAPHRVHERPEEERVEEAFELLDKIGIKVTSQHEIANGHVIQKILNNIQEAEVREIAANILLRAMPRARYDVEPLGHFGLGLQNYGQFTSPIRRASDLVGHYYLRLQRDNKFDVELTDATYDEIDKVCNHITNKEHNADLAEREANKFEMAKYIEEHLGEKFEARVTYINSRGIYIKTPDGIQGIIRPEDLDGDTFYYDDRTISFRGKRSKLKIKIGSQLVLTAIDTRKEYRQINFGLEEDDFERLLQLKRA